MIKNIGDIKLSIDCFLVNILENEDNLVIDNKEDVTVFNINFNWNWINDTLNIWDNENKISLAVNGVKEDVTSLDRIYINNCLMTVL